MMVASAFAICILVLISVGQADEFISPLFISCYRAALKIPNRTILGPLRFPCRHIMLRVRYGGMSGVEHGDGGFGFPIVTCVGICLLRSCLTLCVCFEQFLLSIISASCRVIYFDRRFKASVPKTAEQSKDKRRRNFARKLFFQLPIPRGVPRCDRKRKRILAVAVIVADVPIGAVILQRSVLSIFCTGLPAGVYDRNRFASHDSSRCLSRVACLKSPAGCVVVGNVFSDHPYSAVVHCREEGCAFGSFIGLMVRIM